ncbi:MAG: DUF2764 domain-containing protein [Treponema sp.]|nr:DUF2764 domain-containing protein [Treponema sp.]
MAQLPSLIYEQKPPMSSCEFKELAISQLNKNDAALLNCLSLEPSAEAANGCKFISNWRVWEYNLRYSLAKERAMKLNRDVSAAEPQVYHMDAAAAASKASDEFSPLDGENVIDKARWNAIDSMAGMDYFHRNTVFAYYLKLLLIERREAFNTEKGFAEYKSLYASILESAQNSLGETK